MQEVDLQMLSGITVNTQWSGITPLSPCPHRRGYGYISLGQNQDFFPPRGRPNSPQAPGLHKLGRWISLTTAGIHTVLSGSQLVCVTIHCKGESTTCSAVRENNMGQHTFTRMKIDVYIIEQMIKTL